LCMFANSGSERRQRSIVQPGGASQTEQQRRGDEKRIAGDTTPHRKGADNARVMVVPNIQTNRQVAPQSCDGRDVEPDNWTARFLAPVHRTHSLGIRAARVTKSPQVNDHAARPSGQSRAARRGPSLLDVVSDD